MAADRDFRWAFLVLEEHPYGREMLREILEAGFVPALVLEERSKLADIEREKFLERIAGHGIPPTFTELLEGHPNVRRVQVPHHNGDLSVEALQASAPELIVMGGTRILKPRVFEIASKGALNAHPGLLPEVRGSASVAWSIHLDVPIGCTCHFIEAGIDTGPIVSRRTILVHRGDTYEKLCRATLTLSATLMREALEAHARGELQGTRQPTGGETYRNMPPEMVDEVKRKLAEGRYLHFVD
jgi:methionyl-tRNA formyltransferase